MLCAFACLPAMAAETGKTEASPDSATGKTKPSPDTAVGASIIDRIIHNPERDSAYPKTTLPLDYDEKLQIAQDFKAQYDTSGDPAEYSVTLFQNLSNGMKLVLVTNPDWIYAAYYAYSPIGEYVYSHSAKRVMLYKDGTFTDLLDAYNNGLIDNALLAELDTVMHFDRLAPEPVTVATEPSVDAVAKPATTDTPAEAPATEPNTKPATKDQATPDSPKDSRIPDNGVVATGESGALWFAVLPVLIAAAAGVYVYRRKMDK